MSNARPPRRLDTAIRQKDRQERFLATFVLSGGIPRACLAARIHRQTHYYWLRKDPTYAKRFEMARQMAAQSLEDEAVRRAVEGIRRPVLYQGKQVMIKGQDGIPAAAWEHEYSDQLFITLLKARDPARFNPPKETVNLLELDQDLLTTAQLDKLLDHLIVKMVGNDRVAIEEARRELMAGPVPTGTAASRLKQASEKLQEIVGKVEALVAGAAAPKLEVVLSKMRALAQMLAASPVQ